MKKLFALFITVFCATLVFGQNIVLYDPVSARTYSSDKYSGIRGTPFLVDKWVAGNATSGRGTYVKLQLKLDAFENVLYFNKEDQPLEFAEVINSFVLMPYPADSTSYQYFKKGLTANGLKPDQYVQVLAEGNASLYKSEIKLVSDVNEVNQGVIKTFNHSTRYFLKKGSEMKLIKLNKKDILNALNDKEDKVEEYVKENKLSFSKEFDVIKMMKYYNSL
jgi:hypothetical protein